MKQYWPVLYKVLMGMGGALFVLFFVLPIFAKARVGGGGSCFGALKHIGTTVGVYASDYDDHFPVADRWNDSLGEYTGYAGMFHDPKDVPKDQCGYAFRQQASGAPIHALINPEAFILIFDSTLMGRNEHSELWSIPRPGRHSGGTIDVVCFADGHVKGFATQPLDYGSVPFITPALEADDASGLKTVDAPKPAAAKRR